MTTALRQAQGPGWSPTTERRLRVIAPVSVGVLGLAFWQFLVSVVGVSDYLLPSPAAIAEQFTDARRILNAVTDAYLFPLRERWFGRPAA